MESHINTAFGFNTHVLVFPVILNTLIKLVYVFLIRDEVQLCWKMAPWQVLEQMLIIQIVEVIGALIDFREIE